MPKLANIFVSVVFVVDEYADNPAVRTKKIAKYLQQRYANYEVLVVDNGITRPELMELKQALRRVSCIRVLRLSKSHDTDTAIFAGVEASIGDYICILYNNDPEDLITEFVNGAQRGDIIFGVAKNLVRKSWSEQIGTRLFYWYNKRYLRIDVPFNSTYFICMNRSVANALTRSGRHMRHIRHMAQQVGFSSATYEYSLPPGAQPYSHVRRSVLVSRAIDLVSNYSSHPLRILSYFGLVAGLLNILYAIYVVIVNFSRHDIAKGWTTLSLQSSFMFFVLFMILAVLAEYIGKILNETQQEPSYHVMEELSSVISIADETRRNVTT